MEMPTHTWTAATHTQILATQDQFFQPPCLADRTAFTACSSGQRQTVSHSTLAFAVVSTRARNVPHGSRSTPSAATSRSNINSVVRCLEFGFVSYRIRIVSHRIASVVLVRASSSASQKAVIRKKEKKSSYSQGKSSVERTSNRFRRRPEKQKGAQFRPVWRYFFGVPASRIRKKKQQPNQTKYIYNKIKYKQQQYSEAISRRVLATIFKCFTPPLVCLLANNIYVYLIFVTVEKTQFKLFSYKSKDSRAPHF